MEENKRQVKSSNIIAKKIKRFGQKWFLLARYWNFMRITQEESKLQGIFTDFLKVNFGYERRLAERYFL